MAGPTAEIINLAKSELAQVRNSHIDGPGQVFKYILVKVTRRIPNIPKKDEVSKFVVRGFVECSFHGDIYDLLEASLLATSWDLRSECVGGGRIRHDKNKLTVYGYSQGYGQADHKVAAEILKKDFPSYEIIWSNDGY